jgi:hypothetical protein
MISFTALTCPAPPSISRRSGQASVSRSGSSFSRRWKPPGQHLLHHAEIVAGRQVLARMLNLRYWIFTKPSGPATIIAPTALVPWMWELS